MRLLVQGAGLRKLLDPISRGRSDLVFDMNKLSIVTALDDMSAFDRILADPAFGEVETHPQTGTYGRAYYPAVHGDDFHNLSFAVCFEGVPQVVVLCSLIGKTLGLHGLPARLFARPGSPPDLHRSAIRSAFAHIDKVASANDVHHVELREPATADLSPIGEASIAREAQAAPSLVGRVDLTAEPVQWRKALRKSFRSLVNWGRDNLAITYFNRFDCDAEKFDQYRLFHAEIAGRVTRPKKSWDVMQDWVAAGHGELICGSLNGKLVAASLFIDGTETSIYMSGVYDRSLEKPLAHYMVWHGIERAQARGMKHLHLGDIHLKGTVDDKRYAIGYFSRGFATNIDTYLTWRWRVVSAAFPARDVA